MMFAHRSKLWERGARKPNYVPIAIICITMG